MPCSQLLSVLPPAVRTAFRGVRAQELARVEEIRICSARPLMVTLDEGDRFVGRAGFSHDPRAGILVDAAMVSAVLDAVTRSSVYAFEDAMRDGFLTLPGGHRVGLLGSLRLRAGQVDGYREVVGFNIRLNRPVVGAATRLIRAIMRADGGVRSTLIVSPPGCGKTTLLRDLIRSLSYGEPTIGLRPHRVGVADERSEIAACDRGVPQNDLGPRCDVIDQSPKRFALQMLLRAMGPQVLATDEVGHPEDIPAILDAAGAGVSLLCTVHGGSLEELQVRPAIRPLLDSGLFKRFVVLSRRNGPGTVEYVGDGRCSR